ncbi:MAG TPA: HU family DNA-binding protein [Pantanalinema sp.]
MNKDDLVQVVSDKANSSRKTAEAVVNAALEAIGEALIKGEKVTIIGFGTFAVKERAAREGRNPRTGETIKIPARRSPAFLPGKALKDRIEG